MALVDPAAQAYPAVQAPLQIRSIRVVEPPQRPGPHKKHVVTQNAPTGHAVGKLPLIRLLVKKRTLHTHIQSTHPATEPRQAEFDIATFSCPPNTAHIHLPATPQLESGIVRTAALRPRLPPHTHASHHHAPSTRSHNEHHHVYSLNLTQARHHRREAAADLIAPQDQLPAHTQWNTRATTEPSQAKLHMATRSCPKHRTQTSASHTVCDAHWHCTTAPTPTRRPPAHQLPLPRPAYSQEH